MPAPPPPEETRFKPGQSGNPAGYSRSRRVSDALIALIVEKKADRSLALVWLQKALEGDRHFFRYLLDRVEGPVRFDETPESDGAADDVQAIREFLAAEIEPPKKRSRRRKAAEGP